MRMTTSRPIVLSLIAASVLAAAAARAGGIPADSEALTYSGTLSESGVLVDGARSIGVGLYTSSSGGTAVCSVGPASTTVTRGRFRVTLSADCTAAVRATPGPWVEVAVNGTPHGRAKLAAVPYAVEADNAQKLGGVAAGSYQRTSDDIAATRLTGTVDDARLSGNVPLLSAGSLTIAGTVNALSFSGNGSGLTGVSGRTARRSRRAATRCRGRSTSRRTGWRWARTSSS